MARRPPGILQKPGRLRGSTVGRSEPCMKTLFLVRHAKSSRDEVASSDRERPLAERGQHDAPEMGKRLAQRKVHPDLILSSPARRALETAQIIARKLGYKSEDIVIEDRLYPGQMDELLDMIHALDDKLKRVMLFGHNPALVELAYYLSNAITRMPTCAIADFAFKARSWSEIGATTLASVMLDYPKKSANERSL
jgi:phosphohistidine phosphatase